MLELWNSKRKTQSTRENHQCFLLLLITFSNWVFEEGEFNLLCYGEERTADWNENWKKYLTTDRTFSVKFPFTGEGLEWSPDYFYSAVKRHDINNVLSFWKPTSLSAFNFSLGTWKLQIWKNRAEGIKRELIF